MAVQAGGRSVHGEQVRQSEHDWRHQARQRGEKHCPTPASEFASEQARGHDAGCAGKGGQ